MAQKIVKTVTDDLDGKPADETVRFGLDGVFYEIDLRKSNAERLRKVLEPFQSVARKAAPPQPRRGKGVRSASQAARERSAEIRAWAKANGLTVSERGRIATSIVEAWEAKDPSKAKAAQGSSGEK